MSTTAKIAEFAANLKYEQIPQPALEEAKKAVRDCLGVALAGSREEDAKICAEIARQEGAKEEATVYGQRFKSSAIHAAFANGTAAHAMDFDHSFTLMGQPTAPIIPATFALGEALGASGPRILEVVELGEPGEEICLRGGRAGVLEFDDALTARCGGSGSCCQYQHQQNAPSRVRIHGSSPSRIAPMMA